MLALYFEYLCPGRLLLSAEILDFAERFTQEATMRPYFMAKYIIITDLLEAEWQ
jgi:hypothetical protein